MTYTCLRTFMLAGAMLLSCKKEPQPAPASPLPQPAPEMVYTDLNNREVRYLQPGIVLDADKNGTNDLLFGTRLVGDPVHAVDKLQFFVMTDIYSALPVTPEEQVMPMQTGTAIPPTDFGSSHWYNAAQVLLMEKIESATGIVTWQGNWPAGERKYLPFQLWQQQQRYNGWIELTTDRAAQRLVLHRMAVSREAGKEVKTGN